MFLIGTWNNSSDIFQNQTPKSSFRTTKIRWVPEVCHFGQQRTHVGGIPKDSRFSGQNQVENRSSLSKLYQCARLDCVWYSITTNRCRNIDFRHYLKLALKRIKIGSFLSENERLRSELNQSRKMKGEVSKLTGRRQPCSSCQGRKSISNW